MKLSQAKTEYDKKRPLSMAYIVKMKQLGLRPY